MSTPDRFLLSENAILACFFIGWQLLGWSLLWMIGYVFKAANR